MTLRWKIIITIILAVLAFMIERAVGQVPRQISASGCEAAKTEVESELALSKTYERVNKEFFSGMLPVNTYVRWADLTRYGYMGLTSQLSDGSFVIDIDRATNITVNSTEMTEIHEMCHIATLGKNADTHGPAWHECMVTRAALGAFDGLW